MNVKELKEKLNEFPDDMSVFIYDEEAGFYPLGSMNTKVETLRLVECVHDDKYKHTYWEYPSMFNRTILKEENCLVLNWY